tara:strand:- start:279 stop:860 length:582 start_codon:yes stop_codon:yes gene_type:complete
MVSTLKVDKILDPRDGNQVIIPGHICQTVTGVLGTPLALSVSNKYSYATGIKATITPRTPNPTLIITAQIQFTSSGFNCGYVLYDNTASAEILYNANSTGEWDGTSNRKKFTSGGIGSYGFNTNGTADDEYGNSSRTAVGIYTPPNNSAREIEVRMCAINNAGTIYVGRNVSATNAEYDSYSHCAIIIQEIAG